MTNKSKSNTLDNKTEVLDAFIPEKQVRKRLFKKIYDNSRKYVFDPLLVTTTTYIGFGTAYAFSGLFARGCQIFDTKFKGEDDLLNPKKIDGSTFRNPNFPDPQENPEVYRRPVE